MDHKASIQSLCDAAWERHVRTATLDQDSKNYHTWAYRQWVLAHFGGLGPRDVKVEAAGAGQYPQLWEADIIYADSMIQKDVRNNSAFNHRWFCIFGRAMQGRSELPPDMEPKRDDEIK